MALNKIKTGLQVTIVVTSVGKTTYDLMCDPCAPDNPETLGRYIKIIPQRVMKQYNSLFTSYIYIRVIFTHIYHIKETVS